MSSFYSWLESTSISQFMIGWQWAWPWAEVLHFIGMSLLFGSLLIMDLRLMGYFRRYISLHQVHSLTPWALCFFMINLISGLAFMTTRAKSYVDNMAFDFKMTCMVLAGFNFLVFWFSVRRQIQKLEDDGDAGVLAKTVGFASIALWTMVIWGGRFIPVYGIG